MKPTVSNPQLAGLPPCPVKQCGQCERDDGTWKTRHMGCSICKPDNLPAVMQDAMLRQGKAE